MDDVERSMRGRNRQAGTKASEIVRIDFRRRRWPRGEYCVVLLGFLDAYEVKP
jgi:hypothetical protein